MLVPQRSPGQTGDAMNRDHRRQRPRSSRTLHPPGRHPLPRRRGAHLLPRRSLFSRAPARVGLFERFELAVRVLAPAGAMLIATSLAVRSLTRPFSSPTARSQLIAGLTLLAMGLLQMTYRPQILTAFSDFLGTTANAGVHLVVFLARVVSLTALPLGIALLATQPLIGSRRPGMHTPCQPDHLTSRHSTSTQPSTRGLTSPNAPHAGANQAVTPGPKQLDTARQQSGQTHDRTSQPRPQAAV